MARPDELLLVTVGGERVRPVAARSGTLAFIPSEVQARLSDSGVRLDLADVAQLDLRDAPRVLFRDARFTTELDPTVASHVTAYRGVHFRTHHGVLTVVGIDKAPRPREMFGDELEGLPWETGGDGLDALAGLLFGDTDNTGLFDGPSDMFGDDRDSLRGLGDADFGDFGEITFGDLQGLGGPDDRLDISSWLSGSGGRPGSNVGGGSNPRDRAQWGMDGGTDGDYEDLDSDPNAVYIGEADDWTVDTEGSDAGASGGEGEATAAGDVSDAGASLPGGVGAEPAAMPGDTDLAADVAVVGGTLGAAAGIAGGVAAAEAGSIPAAVAAGLTILAGAASISAGIIGHSHHTPNPEDEGSGRISGPPVFDWNVGIRGEFAHNRHRVRINGEWNAGQSYGWMHFGAPRASGVATPSDDGTDERTPGVVMPNKTMLAVSFRTGSQDDWWLIARGWGWSRYGAPRARYT